MTGVRATISSDHFELEFDEKTGTVKSLGKAKPSQLNYVLNRETAPQFDVPDSRWLGAFGITVDGSQWRSGLSRDVLSVDWSSDKVTATYTGASANPGGFSQMTAESMWSVNGSILSWDLTLKNDSKTSVTIEDLVFPLPMRALWSSEDQLANYEQNVTRHSFIGGDGSYIYWQSPNGEGPILLMATSAGTRLEFKDKARIGEPFGENDPEWEGLIEVAVHSKSLQVRRHGLVEGYLPPTVRELAPGELATYGFTFRWAQGLSDLRQAIYDSSCVDVVSAPGFVVPTDMSVRLALRSIDHVVRIDLGDSGFARELDEANGYQQFEIKFSSLGPSQVVLHMHSGRASVLQFCAISPVASLIDMRAAFLVHRQQMRAPGRGFDGAFMQWDMAERRVIEWDSYAGGGWKEWMAGGSDDLGLGPAAFLAEKNRRRPIQSEVSSVDYFLNNFVLGYLQGRHDDGKRTYQIYRWYDGADSRPTDEGVWRSYNYLHVANTYFSMHRIAALYCDMQTTRTSLEYLELCFRTLDAMFRKIPLPNPLGNSASELALMGEGTYQEILDAFTAAGWAARASGLHELLREKSARLFNQRYPFASEISIDTTAFEGCYSLAKMFGNDRLAESVTRSSLASRGVQPVWYFFGSDNRHTGESWWNLGYETQIGSWQLKDFLAHGGTVAGAEAETARVASGAYFGGWANVNSGQIDANPSNIGAASWQYQSQKGAGEPPWVFMPMLKGWWAWSGEADLGFWGGLRAATVSVVDDPAIGLHAFGGSLTVDGRDIVIQPQDGVGQRLMLFNLHRRGFELDGMQFSHARWSPGRACLSLNLVVQTSAKPEIRIMNFERRSLDIEIAGCQYLVEVATSDIFTIQLPRLEAGEHTARIIFRD